ncbi:MAG TPA: hypothetical protein VII94_00085 [Candidatus Saccharimonadales bacterium]
MSTTIYKSQERKEDESLKSMNINFYIIKAEACNGDKTEWLGRASLMHSIGDIVEWCNRARENPERNGTEEMMFRTMVHRYLSQDDGSLLATQDHLKPKESLELQLVLKVG